MGIGVAVGGGVEAVVGSEVRVSDAATDVVGVGVGV